MANFWNDQDFSGMNGCFHKIMAESAAQRKEEERQHKRQCQKRLAERLSDLTAEEYGEDVLDTMIEAEVGILAACQGPSFHPI